ncbi:hypothetical protein Leryth_026428 [Lithospermum erythrorhizon]|nr:hypothetical protein Leryth_026428 [Lithospermum erythrorhizon]
MNSVKSRRKITPTTTTAAAAATDSGDKLDQLLLSAAIVNGEDIAPFVRKAFASGKPETLLLHLKHFSKSKESEIEEVCRAHYEDFITAVDDLKSLLSDVDSLKTSISTSNSLLQSVASPLLKSLDSFVFAKNNCKNINLAIDSLRNCVELMEVCVRANQHLSEGNFYLALKSVDLIERRFFEKTPSFTLRKMLEKRIPMIRGYIERRREEELRIKQREAEEQSRLSLRDCVYALEDEEGEEEDGDSRLRDDFREGGGGGGLGFDLTALYRAFHIHQTLGLEDRFKKYYFENRKLQLTSDFQVSAMTPFLESHQTFFAQIAGFFIVEDRVLRTGGGLISKMEVESFWDTAVSKMCSVLEDQFSRMQTANHLLLIKDYVSLLGVTLRRYGYPIDALLDVLSKHRDKYHELLLSDCRKQITDALAADKLEQMYMRKEYEYSMNVLSFQIQTSNIMPAFPYVAPFSSMVPDCCRIVRSFIEDSVSFMSHGGQLDFFDVVKKYLDRLLGDVLDGALVKLVNSNVHGVTQAMQVAANMVVFERACDYFFRHAAQLSGLPIRMVERGRRPFPLTKSRESAEETLAGLLKQKVDGFMSLMENVNWMADDTPPGGNEYVNEVIIFLETLVSTAQQILPVQVLYRVLRDVLSHISEMIVGALEGDSVKKFTINSIMGLDVDVRLLESFADNQASVLSDTDASQLRNALVESRQLVNLLLSNHPENFLNPVIRERSYNTLDYRKVVAISEKLRDQSDRLFASFGTRGAKPNTKKKSLDQLIKRLKDV